MRIAVTADVHLQGKGERLDNFEKVLLLIRQEKIQHLVIAGDLFDKGVKGYKEFDDLAGSFTDINMHIIPGNHDPDIRQGHFRNTHITVYSEPEIVIIGDTSFLFLPYKDGSTMGAELVPAYDKEALGSSQWVLVSHGDFGSVNRDENGNETGYFPLTRKDLTQFSPGKVILGHIHKSYNIEEKIYYPGSPWPLNINETGQRRILVFNTGNHQIDRLYLPFAPVNMRADISVAPGEGEMELITQQLQDFLRIACSEINDEYKKNKLNVRLYLHGYTTAPLKDLARKVRGLLEKASIHVDDINTDGLDYIEDNLLEGVAARIAERIMDIDLDYDEREEMRKDILKEALRILYGTG